ncbi:hypothetical protein YN1_8770 [Nanoarchaeota archaeon]
MMKRSVSPLIATIILIALTVALGAIIVGWARGYVNSQVSTLGAQAEILSALYSAYTPSGSSSPSYYLINITVENIGSTAINGNDLGIKLEDGSGNIYKCPYSATNVPFSTVTCYIYNITSVNGSIIYTGTSAPAITSGNIFVIYLNVSPNVYITGSQVTVLYYDNEISSSASVSS